MLTEALKTLRNIPSPTFNDSGDNGSGIVKPDFSGNTYKMSRPNVQKILYKNVQLVCLLYVVF